jgi:hypothetical protein
MLGTFQHSDPMLAVHSKHQHRDDRDQPGKNILSHCTSGDCFRVTRQQPLKIESKM